ncbi:hypothetical protein V5H41_13610 [Salmonella enterica]
MSKVRLAIIGNGMVGHRFIEDLLDSPANWEIRRSWRVWLAQQKLDRS